MLALLRLDIYQKTLKLYMTDKVIENLNRILSLPAIYVCAGSKVLRYIGFVKNNVNREYVSVLHYFLSGKVIRRLCCGDSGFIIHRIGKNIGRNLSIGYDLIPFSNTKEQIQVNDYMLYSPRNALEYCPFINPYSFVEDVLIENGYNKDFLPLYYP